MSGEIIDISGWQLAIGFVFILLAGAVSLYHSLGLERDLLVGAVRTFVQLLLLGFLLRWLFDIESLLVILIVFTFMTVFAALTIKGRVKGHQISLFWPTLASMSLSYLLISYLVTGVVIGVTPWWKPQYFIPLGGMVIGNSMNAVAVSLDRLLSDLHKRSQEVEMMLCLGADFKEASADMLRAAMRAGMIPSINSMMAAGVVFIPGMMTGQILAGADPMLAIRYQIVVMVMLVGSTALSSLLVLVVVRRLCFGSAHQLRLRRSSERS